MRAPERDAETAESLIERVTALVDTGDGAVTVVRAVSATGRVVLRCPEGVDVLGLARSIDERSDVEFAEPDVLDRAALVPNDTLFAEQYAPVLVRAPQAWDLETGQPAVLIGIIDSGISMTNGVLDHPDLADPTRIIVGTDFVDGGVPRDLSGHGTHVAGIAAAMGNNGPGIAGMNWGSRVYVCRTLDAAPTAAARTLPTR